MTNVPLPGSKQVPHAVFVVAVSRLLFESVSFAATSMVVDIFSVVSALSSLATGGTLTLTVMLTVAVLHRESVSQISYTKLSLPV